MRTILSKGAHSTVFTDDNEPGMVIKENLGQDARYLERQLYGDNIIRTIKANYADTGVMLPEIIETKNLGNKQIIKEKIIPGKDFNIDLYQSLSEEQKNNIAKQMAMFLNAMHQSFPIEAPKESIKNMTNGKLNSANDIIAKFAGTLPKNVETRLKQAEQYLITSDISDELIVMTHKDLRTANIIYDKDTGKLAVIDFELAGHGNVYRDFIPYSTSTSMPWDFTKRVIEYYNKIPNKKHPIKINQEKVKNMLVYALLCEIARATSPQDMQNTTEKDIKELYQMLKTIAGIDFDTKSAFTKGVHNVQALQLKSIIPTTNNFVQDR